jgi:acyl-CoA synthetase (NDP forming)
VLPSFASPRNPVDITGALLSDSTLVRKVLDCVEPGVDGDAFLISIPVSGQGYDTDEFASAAADFVQRLSAPLAIVTPQPKVAATYRKRGLPVYEDEAHAIRALAGYTKHHALRAGAAGRRELDLRPPSGTTRLLNEAQSLAALAGVADVVEHVLVEDARHVAEACARFGGRPVVVKGCTSSVSHKSDYGLVELGITSPTGATEAAERILAAMSHHDFDVDGVLLAPMERAAFEVMVGAHRDANYGAVVMLGAGGRYIEAVPDFETLLPPFDIQDATAAISRLRMAPLLQGVRGEQPLDVTAWAELAVAVGDLMVDPASNIESLDANPVLLIREAGGTRAVVADAVVVSRCAEEKA